MPQKITQGKSMSCQDAWLTPSSGTNSVRSAHLPLSKMKIYLTLIEFASVEVKIIGSKGGSLF